MNLLPELTIRKNADDSGRGQNLLPELSQSSSREEPGFFRENIVDPVKQLFSPEKMNEFKNYISSPEGVQDAVGAALMALPAGGAVKLGKEGVSLAKKGIEYIKPAKDAEKFMNDLGEGRTATDNARQLSKLIKSKKDINMEEALNHKNKVTANVGENNIFRPEEDKVEALIKILNKNKNQFSYPEKDTLSKKIQLEMKKYNKTGRVDKFVDNLSPSFESGSPKIITETKLPAGSESSSVSTDYYKKIEEILSGEAAGKYGKHGEAFRQYPSSLKEIHNDYMKSPTVNKSYDLSSQLGDEIGWLMRKSRMGTLETAERGLLKKLKFARDDLIGDRRDYLGSVSKNLKKNDELFTEKWRENVEPYNHDPILYSMGKQGEFAHVVPSEIKNLFQHASKITPNLGKVIKDIGPKGAKNILFNELQFSKEGDVQALANAIKKSKNLKGLQEYIPKESFDFAKELEKRQSIRNMALKTGSVAGGLTIGSMLGHPIYGLLAGIVPAISKPIMTKTLEMISKK